MAARSGEWAQHFSNASCFRVSKVRVRVKVTARVIQRQHADIRPEMASDRD